MPPGSPDFPAGSLLVSEYASDAVGVYQYDSNGDPDPNSRADFITNLVGAEGAVIDPVTGDFLFSTFGGNDRVIVIEGFVPPAPPGTPTSTPTATEPSGTEEPAAATPTATTAGIELPETGTGGGGDTPVFWPVAAIFGLSGGAIALAFARIRARRVR